MLDYKHPLMVIFLVILQLFFLLQLEQLH
jgi:hypothetical protein